MGIGLDDAGIGGCHRRGAGRGAGDQAESGGAEAVEKRGGRARRRLEHDLVEMGVASSGLSVSPGISMAAS
jgi:hypothetical protein